MSSYAIGLLIMTPVFGIISDNPKVGRRYPLLYSPPLSSHHPPSHSLPFYFCSPFLFSFTNKRMPMVLGLFSLAVSTIFFMFAWSFYWLVFARVLQGARYSFISLSLFPRLTPSSSSLYFSFLFSFVAVQRLVGLLD